MAKAFLSHSSADHGVVLKVAKALGGNALLDDVTFEAGMPILDEIFTKMERSDLLVLFLSDEALNSEWVQHEITLAENRSVADALRILPIIIDSKTKHTDPRIPDWLRRSYNIQPIQELNIILNKIYSRLRELDVMHRKSEIPFCGRTQLLSKVDQDFNSSDFLYPTCVIAHSFVTGIGRRSFLKEALVKQEELRVNQEPITVNISNTESIESFIYQLKSIKYDVDAAKLDLSVMSSHERMALAKTLVLEYVAKREVIFIIDNGGIVLPNRRLADWFKDLVHDPDLHGRLCFCVISNFAPNAYALDGDNKILSYPVSELDRRETLTMFNRLLRKAELTNASKGIQSELYEAFSGVPTQIIFGVEVLKAGEDYARRHIEEVSRFADMYPQWLISELREQSLKENGLAYQLLIFLSTNDVVSMRIIDRVFQDKEAVTCAIARLEDYSCITPMFQDHGFVRLSHPLARVIRQSGLTMEPKYRDRYDAIRRELCKQELETLLANDYSEFTLGIKEKIARHQQIAPKYFMPSLVLNSILREYQEGHYQYVVDLCRQLLAHLDYDRDILWVTHYRLAQALAHLGKKVKDEFLGCVKFFRDNGNMLDYWFLMGFYQRNCGNNDTALQSFRKVLAINNEHERTLREIVNCYIAKGEYDKAVELARNNYRNNRSDILQIHAYFVSLVNSRQEQPQATLTILQRLMDEVRQSADARSKDIAECMEGEYEFYVQGNLSQAMDTLDRECRNAQNGEYALRALKRIRDRVTDTTLLSSLSDLITDLTDYLRGAE